MKNEILNKKLSGPLSGPVTVLANRRTMTPTGLQGLLVLIVLLTVGWALAGRADAQTTSSSLYGYGNSESKVLVQPKTVQVSVDNEGNVTLNPEGHVVYVKGYGGENYLKYENGQAYLNKNSEAAIANGQLAQSLAPGQTLAPTDDWIPLTGKTLVWHDHRAHWMVALAPNTRIGDELSNNNFDITVDGRPEQFTVASYATQNGSNVGGESTKIWVWAGLIVLLGGASVAVFYVLHKNSPQTQTEVGSQNAA